MARQRGGIAGFYDRNKGILQTLAPIAAGAIGGPMAGAAVGAAMRGFDRPGKSGIGFDIGQGALGGITGYGAGQMGQSLRGGIAGLFAPKTSLPPVDMASKIGITGTAATPSLPPIDVASKIGLTPTKPFASDRAAAFVLGNQTMPVDISRVATANPLLSSAVAPPTPSPAAATRAMFAPASRPAVAAPTTTPSPAAAPSFFRSREGIAALGQGAQAAAGLIGSQRQMAMEQERMDREQREAEARAQLMAMFAPRILSGFSTGYGSMAGGG